MNKRFSKNVNFRHAGLEGDFWNCVQTDLTGESGTLLIFLTMNFMTLINGSPVGINDSGDSLQLDDELNDNS